MPPPQRTNEFIDNLFSAFDTNQSGEIDFKQLMAGLNWATSEKPEEVIAFNFRVLDVDSNGYLDEQEIQYAVELVFKVRNTIFVFLFFFFISCNSTVPILTS